MVMQSSRMTKINYFAYGSNMLTRRLKAVKRAPSAVCLGTGYVTGRRLTFDKLSKDCSGKCDAELTGNEIDRVYGVIFEISCKDETALDRTEGCGKGYEKKTVEVTTADTTVLAQTYIATQKVCGVQPYHWYKAIVVAGAVEHNLPAAYIEWLRTCESKADPIAERREKNERLLFRGKHTCEL